MMTKSKILQLLIQGAGLKMRLLRKSSALNVIRNLQLDLLQFITVLK